MVSWIAYGTNGKNLRPVWAPGEKKRLRLQALMAKAQAPVAQTGAVGSASTPAMQGGQIIAAPETWGNIIPITAGERRVLGSYIWLTVGVDGKMNCAVAFGAPADSTGTSTVTKIWADGGVIYEAATNTKLAGMNDPVWYDGGEDQIVDSDIAADYGAGRTPAYRGIMYVKLKNIDIVKYFNGRPPSIEAFIVDSGGTTWTVGEVIKTIGRMGGYSDDQMAVDADINDPVIGPYLIENTSARDMWLAIGRAYNVDMVDGGEAIVFSRPVNGEAYDVEDAVPEENLILPPGASAISLVRRDMQDIPARVEVTYVDSAQPWRFSTRPARRVTYPLASTPANQANNVKLQIIMSAIDAQTLASKVLYRENESRTILNFQLPWAYLWLMPGDVLEVPFAGMVDTVKVVRADVQPDLTIEVQAYRLQTAENYTVNAETGIVDEPYVTPPTTNITLAEIDFTTGTYVINGVAVDVTDIFDSGTDDLNNYGTFNPALISSRGLPMFYENEMAARAIGPLKDLFLQPFTIIVEWEHMYWMYGEGFFTTSTGGSGSFIWTFLDTNPNGEWTTIYGSDTGRRRQWYGLNKYAFTLGTDLSNFSWNGSTINPPTSQDMTSFFTTWPVQHAYPLGGDHVYSRPTLGWIRKVTVLAPVSDEQLPLLSAIETPEPLTDVALGTITSSSVEVTFTPASGATGYEYWIGNNPSNPSYAEPIYPDDVWLPLPNDRIITGLSSGTQYQVWVRPVNAHGPGGAGIGYDYPYLNFTTL